MKEKLVEKCPKILYGELCANEDLIPLFSKDWWLDSHCREITMQMAVYVEPLLREWELKSKIILENDSVESIKENLNRLL